MPISVPGSTLYLLWMATYVPTEEYWPTLHSLKWPYDPALSNFMCWSLCNDVGVSHRWYLWELHDLLRSLAKSHVLCRIQVPCRIGVCSLVIQAVFDHVTMQYIWQMGPVQLVHRKWHQWVPDGSKFVISQYTVYRTCTKACTRAYKCELLTYVTKIHFIHFLHLSTFQKLVIYMAWPFLCKNTLRDPGYPITYWRDTYWRSHD